VIDLDADGGRSESDRDRSPSVLLSAGAAALLAATLVTGVVVTRSGPDGAVAAPDTTHAAHDGHQPVGVAGEPDPEQLASISAAMARYRDVDEAYAAGWVQEHPDWPGTGAHFYRDGDWAGAVPARPELDPLDPEFLMYSQLRTGDWELVAVAYVVDQARYPEPPDDLHGAVFHEHVWTCVVDGEELEEDEVGPISRDECRAMDGEWDPGGVWMTHVWFIENPDGVFAEENPELD
jgi:hypothetical protein